MRRPLLGAVLAAAMVTPVLAQNPAIDSTANPAEPAIVRWLGLVAGGAADQAYSEASIRFRTRITQSAWRDWVTGNTARFGEAGPRRTIELTFGHDEAPLPELDWVRVVYARNRALGGRIFERVIAVSDGDDWRIADFAAWPDAEAVVSSGSLLPVPFAFGYAGAFLPGFLHGRFGRRPRPGTPPSAGRPTARANPATFPKKPPPG